MIVVACLTLVFTRMVQTLFWRQHLIKNFHNVQISRVYHQLKKRIHLKRKLN